MKNKKRKRINNTIDLILLLLFFGIGLYFAIEAIVGKLIPFKYIGLFVVVLVGLVVLIFLTFKTRNTVFRMARKIFLGIMCCVLFFGGVFQGQIRNAFSNVNNGSVYKDYMYVIIRKQDSFHDLNEIHSFVYVDQESELLNYSLNQLKEFDFKHVACDTLDEALIQLDSKQVDAVLISAKDQALQKKSGNSHFVEKYKTLHTIEMVIHNDVEVVENDLTSKPFVVYIAGLDDMGEPTQMGHHDVNMLLMVDPIRHHVEIISINRDTYIPNVKMNDYPDKLTHLGWYGPQVASDTLERVFGIEIDYYAKVTFESLIKIIDTMGGIDVDVKLSFTEQDEYRSFDENDLIHLEKGFQHLNGSQALAYARHRHTEGWDVKGREQAQRDIIAAVVKKILSVEGAFKVGEVVNVAASYVATNMSMDSAKAFVMHAIDEKQSWSFGSYTVNSAVELLLPCAMEGDLERFVVMLKESDIQQIHDMYVLMNTQVNFHEFAFDLNDMTRYMDTFTLDKHVVTIENYYDVVAKYFPTYLRYRF